MSDRSPPRNAFALMSQIPTRARYLVSGQRRTHAAQRRRRFQFSPARPPSRPWKYPRALAFSRFI